MVLVDVYSELVDQVVDQNIQSMFWNIGNIGNKCRCMLMDESFRRGHGWCKF